MKYKKIQALPSIILAFTIKAGITLQNGFQQQPHRS